MEAAVLEDKSDEYLMDSFLQGDARAFEKLVSRYQVRLYNFILYRIRDRARAEEMLQEVFTRVVHRGAGFRQRASFKSWIYTITTNLCIDEFRSKKHRRVVVSDPAMNGGGDSPPSRVLQSPDPGPGPDRLAESIRLRRSLDKALDELPEDQREVFLLKEKEGLTFREISDLLETKEGTVKSRMRYALNSLREALKEYHQPDE